MKCFSSDIQISRICDTTRDVVMLLGLLD